jgi:ribonuclease HI
VKLMWIPSHVGLVGNELVDERARSLARPALMRTWHAKWDSVSNGRLAHSFFL